MRNSRSSDKLLPLRPKRFEKQVRDISIEKMMTELTVSKQNVIQLEKRIQDLEIDLSKERAINDDLRMMLKAQETVVKQNRRLRKEKEKTLSMEQTVREQIQTEYSNEVDKLKGQVNYYKSRLLAKNASANIAQKENPKLRRQIAELKDQLLRESNTRRFAYFTD